MKTTRLGHAAELAFESEAHRRGFVVSKPTMATRYDAILDDGENRWRVQIKSCEKKDKRTGAFVVNLADGPRRKPYQINEIDAVVVFFPELKKLCWLRVDQVIGKRNFTIRNEQGQRTRKNSVFIRDLLW